VLLFVRIENPHEMPSTSLDDRSLLKDILVRKSLSTDGNFTLHSGEKSAVYVDGKLTTCLPEAMPLVGRLFLEKIRECEWIPEAIGGLTVGADPIAFSVARESLEERQRIKAFIVRKEPKKHGTQKFIEGLDQTEGRNVVIVDDVCTKGESTWQAADKARQAGMHVLGAICLVDREQGATALLAEKGITLVHIFTLKELLSFQEEIEKAASLEHTHNR
jgi:orotate phosphoribosyltransferase